MFVDDGIIGAELSARPGFVRLKNALRPKPAFQVLIMPEGSRLGREAIATAYALKQIGDTLADALEGLGLSLPSD